MMRLLSTVSVLFLAASTFAQGTVSFSNRTSLGDWKVALIGEVPAGLSPYPIAVNIFLADPSGLGPTGSSLASTSFRNSSAAAAFFVTSIDEIDVNTLAPGTSAQKFIAQFTGANINTKWVGLVINPNLPAGGGTPPNPPGELLPADRSLLGGTISLFLPEPSTIALSIFGAAVLLLVRRR